MVRFRLTTSLPSRRWPYRATQRSSLHHLLRKLHQTKITGTGEGKRSEKGGHSLLCSPQVRFADIVHSCYRHGTPRGKRTSELTKSRRSSMNQTPPRFRNQKLCHSSCFEASQRGAPRRMRLSRGEMESDGRLLACLFAQRHRSLDLPWLSMAKMLDAKSKEIQDRRLVSADHDEEERLHCKKLGYWSNTVKAV